MTGSDPMKSHSFSGTSGRPLSVCHIFPALPLHGAENHFLKLCTNLDPRKIRTSILLISDGGELVPDFEALGIPVTLILKKSRYDFSIISRVRSYLKAGEFDIIHTHLFTANFWGRLAALGTDPLLISSAHNVVPKERPGLVRVENFLDRTLSMATDAIFCVTNQVLHSMVQDAGLPRHKLVAIENGIAFESGSLPSKAEARGSLGLDPDRLVLAVIGRFSAQKNHVTFLQAFKEVQSEFPGLSVLFVGEGELEETVRNEVSRLGFGDSVRFLGQRRDVGRILRAIDMLVVPSLWEGLPNVMLEGMAAGTPVIATRVGGIPDVLDDRETGLLCEPDRESLKEALFWALENPEEMERMAVHSLSLIRERYDIRTTAKRYTGFYEGLVRHRRFSRGAKDVIRRTVGTLLSHKTRNDDRSSGSGGGELRVLMYHRVHSDPGTDILSVTPFAFFEQMKWLREEGYPVLPVPDALSRMKNGMLPAGAVAVTFDDGYRDNYEEAFPVLSRFKIPAMIFPVTGFVLGEGEHPRYRGSSVPVGYLSIEEIREMKGKGLDFGCHTHSHPLLSRIPLESARSEIERSKRLLEEWVGEPVRVFAYPNGDFSPEHFPLLDSLGFDEAFSVRPGVNTAGENRWLLRRTEISGRDNLGDFVAKMRGGFDMWHRLYQKGKGSYS